MAALRFFCVSVDAEAVTASTLLAAAHRRPLQKWERRDLGYSCRSDRTIADALRTVKYYNCKALEQIKHKLRPDGHEVIAVVTVNLIEKNREKARIIVDNALKAATGFRYWVLFLEPTCEGLPHYNLLIRLSKRHLGRFEKALDEIAMELFEREGFAGIIDLGLCDSESWHNHQPGHWPWPLGYSSKHAYNLDKILSFTAWVKENGKRWNWESRKCVRTDAGPIPYGYVPLLYAPENPTESSTLSKQPLPPFASNLAATLDEAVTASSAAAAPAPPESETSTWDQIHHDEDNVLDYISLWAEDKNQLQARINRLTEKKKQTDDKNIKKDLSKKLKIVEAIKKQRYPTTEKDKLWGRYFGSVKNYADLCDMPGVDDLSYHLAKAKEDGNDSILTSFNLHSTAHPLYYGKQEYTAIHRELSGMISDWDGKNIQSKREISRTLCNLAEREHWLRFARVHIDIEAMLDKLSRNLMRMEVVHQADIDKLTTSLDTTRNRSEIATIRREIKRLENLRDAANNIRFILSELPKLMKFHRKLTKQSYWLRFNDLRGRVDRIAEMVECHDLRRNSTRAMHGLNALKKALSRQKIETELKSNDKDQPIRKKEQEEAVKASGRCAKN